MSLTTPELVTRIYGSAPRLIDAIYNPSSHHFHQQFPQFPQFPILPAEIRLQIWRSTFPSPGVSFITFLPPPSDLSSSLAPGQPFSLPTTLHICRESRSETLAHYILYQPSPQIFPLTPGGTWRPLCFNPKDDDIILVDRSWENPVLSQLLTEIVQHDSLLRLPLIHKLRTIRLDWESFNGGIPWGYGGSPDCLFIDWSKVRRVVDLLPNIEVVGLYQSEHIMRMIRDQGPPMTGLAPYDTEELGREMEAFVRETKKNVPGHKIERLELVKFPLEDEDDDDGYPRSW